jgi:hypothetical protein
LILSAQHHSPFLVLLWHVGQHPLQVQVLFLSLTGPPALFPSSSLHFHSSLLFINKARLFEGFLEELIAAHLFRCYLDVWNREAQK